MTITIQESLLRRLHFLRRMRNLSQREFADTLDISYRSYQRLEYGEKTLTLDNLAVLSEKLSIPISELFEEQNREGTFFLHGRDLRTVPLFEEHSKESLVITLSEFHKELAADNGSVSKEYAQCYITLKNIKFKLPDGKFINKKNYSLNSFLSSPSSAVAFWDYLCARYPAQKYCLFVYTGFLPGTQKPLKSLALGKCDMSNYLKPTVTSLNIFLSERCNYTYANLKEISEDLSRKIGEEVWCASLY